MYRITFVLGGESSYRNKAMRILLAALTLVDKAYFDLVRNAPPLKKLRFEEEAPGADDWMDASALARLGGGDCEDICCYVAGWLQSKHGIMAWPQLVEKNGHTHIVVELPGGRQFDPTLMIGRKESLHGEGHACTGHGKEGPEQRITFVTDLFSPGKKNYKLAHRSLEVMLHALYLIDVEWLQRHPETPWLYESGAYYEVEPVGREDWQDWPTTMRRKSSDCEDLANMRASELFVRQGIKARPSFIWKMRPSGANLYHIQVTYPDGSVEDPSRRLGMGAP